MILLNGLLRGEIEPEPSVVRGLFECFACGHCERSCSSGVPVLQVLRDARWDLAEMGLACIGTTAVSDESRCALCLQCVRGCDRHARVLSRGRIETNRVECISCGSCIDQCPGRAIQLGESFETTEARVVAAVSWITSEYGAAPLQGIVLACAWSTYPGLQFARYPGPPPQDVLPVRIISCVGRITQEMILQVLRKGAKGVLVLRCREDECQHGGSRRGALSVKAARRSLAAAGWEDCRIQECVIGRGDVQGFSAAVARFSATLEGLRAMPAPAAPGSLPKPTALIQSSTGDFHD